VLPADRGELFRPIRAWQEDAAVNATPLNSWHGAFGFAWLMPRVWHLVLRGLVPMLAGAIFGTLGRNRASLAMGYGACWFSGLFSCFLLTQGQ